MEQSETQPFISVPDPGAYLPSPTGNRIAIRADGTQTGGVSRYSKPQTWRVPRRHPTSIPVRMKPI